MEKGRQSPRMQDGFRDIVPVPPPLRRSLQVEKLSQSKQSKCSARSRYIPTPPPYTQMKRKRDYVRFRSLVSRSRSRQI